MADLVDTLVEASTEERISVLTERAKNEPVSGDFDGTVIGTWVRLGKDGTGVVRYKDRNYVTRPLGFTVISVGAKVELTFADGVYTSKW